MKILSDLISVYRHERGAAQSIFVMARGYQQKKYYGVGSLQESPNRKKDEIWLTYLL